MQLPGEGWIWHQLNIQFKNPVFLHEEIQIVGRVTHLNSDLGVIRIEVEMLRGDAKIAKAEAQAGRLKQ